MKITASAVFLNTLLAVKCRASESATAENIVATTSGKFRGQRAAGTTEVFEYLGIRYVSRLPGLCQRYR